VLQADQTPNIHQAGTNERAGGTTPPALGIRSSALGSIVIRPGERIVANAIAPPVWAAKMKAIVVAAACDSVRSPERGLTCFSSDPDAMQSDSARLRWYRRSQALPADGHCR
jgi:hypothetical protein